MPGKIHDPIGARIEGTRRELETAAHTRLREPGERADDQLESWRILRKPQCGPSKAGHLVKAVAVLETQEVTRG